MTTSSRKRWPLFRFLADRLERFCIVPTPRLIRWAALAAVLVAAGYALGFGWPALLLVNALLAGLSAADLSLLPRRRSLTVRRQLPASGDIGKPLDLALHIQSPEPVHLFVTAADDWPTSFAEPGTRIDGRWEGKNAELRYTVKPKERGLYRLARIQLRYWGGLGLWAKQLTVLHEQDIKIYPDLSAVRGVLSSMQDSLVLDGKKIYRRERAGSEFHAIREHVQDDDPRLINWQASARSGTLMTNIYRPERGKIVCILIDCGRMMGIELDGRTKLDVSLEAALALAAVALKQGDQVAVLAFSNRIRAYVPPGNGLSHLQVIIEALYDLRPEFVESSYSTALQHLMRVVKKRSMTVLFSDMDNYLFEDQLLPHLLRLRRSHFLLLLAIRDEVLHAWTRTETAGKREAFAKSIAHQFTLERKSYTASMAAKGIHVVDVPAGELAVTAVNRYLDVKSRDAL